MYIIELYLLKSFIIFASLVILIKKEALSMYSSKLSVSKRFCISVTWNILCIFPCSVNLNIHNIVKEPGREKLPGTFKLLSFECKLLILVRHTLTSKRSSKKF